MNGPPLLALVRRLIEEQGPISVAAYMALALGHPRHGYYAGRDPFGVRGDFVTAPEISQVFGECVAVWCTLAWEAMGRPPRPLLVELGPGRGTLMADLMRTLDHIAPPLARSARLHLVETSPTLRARQKAALVARSPTWHDSIARVPPGPLLLVANEFFDALPVRQFLRVGDGWRERLVAWDAAADRLVFQAGPALPGAATGAVPGETADAPDGSIYEISPAATALAEEIGARLTAAPGAALIIDYGRRAPSPGDSLAAIRHGRKDADPLAAPGEADLTAHVDFSALAAALGKTGARCRGPVSQGDLLRALGIEARLEMLAAGAAPAAQAALAAGVRRLIAPDGMGTLFLALSATSPELPPLPGFDHESA
jgi:NADH dehydrogenase [ubiquinone] 1 alpha subcomplex assembly factor 7